MDIGGSVEESHRERQRERETERKRERERESYFNRCDINYFEVYWDIILIMDIGGIVEDRPKRERERERVICTGVI